MAHHDTLTMSEVHETVHLKSKIVVLHKYLKDEQKYFVCYSFSQMSHRIPELSMFREIAEYYRLVATV